MTLRLGLDRAAGSWPVWRLAMLAALPLAGCASPMTAADKQTFSGDLNAGNYQAAEADAVKAGGVGADGKTTNVVWSLNAGAAQFAAGDDKEAVATLDNTEKLAQANDLNHMKGAVDYTYTTYDGVMTNLYKAVAFLKLGDPDNARVEFNRAEDRQRRAEETFKAEIAQAEQQAGSRPADFDDMMQKAQQSSEYASATQHLSQLAAYTPFENPFATYLGGVFFVSEGDYPKGIEWLKRASQELGPDSPATTDLIWAELQHKARSHKKAVQTWVVFENGQSSTYHEVRIILPTVNGTPMTLAMPTLQENGPAAPALSVKAGLATANTIDAGSFDAVMASEFGRRRPAILARAVTEVLLKNVSSAIAANSNNGWLKLASLVVNNVSSADTRSWTALPKQFQAVRVQTPLDGVITLATADGQPLGTATAPTDKSSIVWVKMQAPGAHPAITVAPL